MLIKSYTLPNTQFFLLKIKEKIVLNYNNLIYFVIPNYIHISLKNLMLNLTCKNLELRQTFLNFTLLLNRWLKRTLKLYRKKLILKGLGIRANFSADLKFLELKLGFSHLIRVFIPKKYLSIKLLKNTISVTGCCSVFVSNFLYKLRWLKVPNVYKGKGLWFKNEVRKLKVVKKT